MRVADIGAGDGFYTLKIAAAVAPGRVTGGLREIFEMAEPGKDFQVYSKTCLERIK